MLVVVLFPSKAKGLVAFSMGHRPMLVVMLFPSKAKGLVAFSIGQRPMLLLPRVYRCLQIFHHGFQAVGARAFDEDAAAIGLVQVQVFAQRVHVEEAGIGWGDALELPAYQ